MGFLTVKLFQTRFISFTFCIILISTFISVNNGESQEVDAEGGEEEESKPEETCQKSIINLIQGAIVAITNCLGGKFPLRSIFDFGTRFYCLVRCVLQDLGVIGADGKLDEVSAVFYFQENIPEAVRGVVTADAQPCLSLADQFQPKEYYCQSYATFVRCVVSSVLRTFTPYVLDCFTSPGLGFFFNFIDLIVPRPSGGGSETSELRRRRISEQRLRSNKTRHNRIPNRNRTNNSTQLTNIKKTKKNNNTTKILQSSTLRSITTTVMSP